MAKISNIGANRKREDFIEYFLYKFFDGQECVGHSFAYVVIYYFWEMSEELP